MVQFERAAVTAFLLRAQLFRRLVFKVFIADLELAPHNEVERSSPKMKHVNKHKWPVAVFFILWMVLGSVAWCLVDGNHGYWIELFNGATWPSQFVPSEQRPTPNYGFWFYVVVSLRALLNSGFLFTAIVAFFFISTGQWKGLLMNKFNSTYRTSNSLLAERILQVLEEHAVVVPVSVEAAVRKEAQEFSEKEGVAVILQRVKNAAASAEAH